MLPPLLTPGLGLFVWNLLAFVIVFLLLKKFAWGPIMMALTDREKHINDSIQTADRVKAEMAQLKNENEALMAQAREERSQMLKEARETRDKIVQEAKDKAKVEANKIVAEAQVTLEQQKQAAIADIKNQVGGMVVEIAEKVLRRELASKSAQENYIQELSNDIKLN